MVFFSIEVKLSKVFCLVFTASTSTSSEATLHCKPLTAVFHSSNWVSRLVSFESTTSSLLTIASTTASSSLDDSAGELDFLSLLFSSGEGSELLLRYLFLFGVKNNDSMDIQR